MQRRGDWAKLYATDNYHSESGLVYREVLVEGTSGWADWLHQSEGSVRDIRHSGNQGPGCLSLKNLARCSLLRNLELLTTESLSTVPWVFAATIWKDIKKSGLDSFHVWRTFVIAYYDEPLLPKSLALRSQVIPSPELALDHYLKLISSPSFQWLTHLSLSHVACTRRELIEVGKLTNLTVLCIGKGVNAPDYGLDRRLLRLWAEAAQDPNLRWFGRLRQLVCMDHLELSKLTFGLLSQFPCLTVFASHAARALVDRLTGDETGNWHYQTGSDPLVAGYQPLIGKTTTWSDFKYALLQLSEGVASSEKMTRPISSARTAATLEFSLGPPPPRVYTFGSTDAAWCMRIFTRERMETCSNLPDTDRFKRQPGSKDGPEPTTKRRRKLIRAAFSNPLEDFSL